ncbi:hypothetical protein [Streptomyces lunaelactis]|uniref:hypothetical protein n=1 Tax=Streptomyces lunaelactis TaxID=1535768 RepID=UPI001585A697|nr:hypothetical protein [Streptomyces lunaelactis]NUK14061.1 hypothetical protein [Streptomyces lunaelactis]
MAQLRSKPLADFLSALGLQPTDGDEDTKRFSITQRIEAESVTALQFETVKPFADSYGPAIELAEINIRDVQMISFLGEDFSADDLQAQQERLDSGDECILRVSISKELLTRAVLGVDGSTAIFFFFFSELLERTMPRDLVAFEDAVWGEEIEYRRILVGDTDIRRSGMAFEIVGTQSVGIPQAARQISVDTAESIRRMRDGRIGNVSLEHPWIRNLTPNHVQLDDGSMGSHLEKTFSSLHIRLCMLYLCDRARRKDIGIGPAEIQAEYGLVKVFIPESGLIAPTIDGKANEHFANLVNWCYQARDGDPVKHWATDRLKLARVRIALELEPYPDTDTDRALQLVRMIGNVWMSMESHWRAFIEDRLSKYLDEEHKLESIASDAVRNAGERSVALTKTLTDTMLAAVAAVIGAAIAAAFRPTFDEDLFRVLVLSYAGYMLIFPGIYGLSSQVNQYKSFRKSFQHDKSHFVNLLDQSRVDQIVGNRDKESNLTYWRTFRSTLGGFVLAAAVAVAAAFIVPAVVC